MPMFGALTSAFRLIPPTRAYKSACPSGIMPSADGLGRSEAHGEVARRLYQYLYQ
jgi:hypothetical protein